MERTRIGQPSGENLEFREQANLQWNAQLKGLRRDEKWSINMAIKYHIDIMRRYDYMVYAIMIHNREEERTE